MLHHCTSAILSDLNQYIQSRLSLKLPPVSLAVLTASQTENKPSQGIVMRLVDITPVDLCTNPTQYLPQKAGFFVRKAPQAFHLYYLFSIDYKSSNILKDLELLAYVAAFFQTKSHFDSCNTPILQEVAIESFAIELVNMTLLDKSMLWQNLNMPYSPSLLYKVGLIFIGDATMDLKVVSPFLSHEK